MFKIALAAFAVMSGSCVYDGSNAGEADATWIDAAIDAAVDAIDAPTPVVITHPSFPDPPSCVIGWCYVEGSGCVRCDSLDGGVDARP